MTLVVNLVKAVKLANLFCFKHCIIDKCLDCIVKDFVKFAEYMDCYPVADPKGADV